jgi:mannosyltransferase
MTLSLQRSDPAPPPVRDRTGRRTTAVRRWLPVAGPGLLMLTVGLIGSTVPVLSWDEIATADVAHRSARQIWHLVHHIDGVFGPYYLTLHGWTRLFGDSVLSLRLPSVLAMAAAAALTGELGRRLSGPTTGVVAGVLLCLIPNISRYAAEARPYALACMFSILALLLLDRALERPHLGRWIGYAAALLATGLCSLVAMSALVGHVAMLVIRRPADRSPWRARVLPWSAAVLGALLVLTPLIWWGLHQRRAQLDWVAPMTAGAVYTFPAHLLGSTEAAWLLIGLLVLASGCLTGPVLAMISAAVLPLAAVCAISFAGPSFWIARYLLFVLLPAAIAAAVGLTQIRSGSRAGSTVLEVAALSVFTVAALPAQVAMRQPTLKNGSDYRTLAAAIVARQQPGDYLVFEKGRTMRAGMSYYLRHDAGAPKDVLLRQSAAVTATLIAAEYPDPGARLAGATRIWLVAYGRRADPATARPDLAPMLRAGYQRLGRWEVKNGSMALYTKRPAP